MARRVHQTSVRNLQGWGEGKVFSSAEKTDAGLAHAVEGVATLRRDVCEVAAREHIGRVSPCDLGEFRIGRQRPQSCCDSLPVHELQHGCF